MVLACRRAVQVTRMPIAALSAALERDDPSPQAGDLPPPLRHRIYWLSPIANRRPPLSLEQDFP